jgi:thiamine pyrophosphate-dependent enzyme
MRVFESVIAGLQDIGIDVAFGDAGETAMGMMLALEHSRIKGIITRHEQAVINAHITHWAIPHFSPSPEHTIAGIVEPMEQQLRNE